MSQNSETGLQSKFFYAGILFAVNFGIVGLIWRFRGVNWILLVFSIGWVLLVTAFAWEIVTRAERLDQIVQARTNALEETNRHLTAVLGRLRAFHRISYEINQRIELGKIARIFVDELEERLPQVDSAWLWLERALLRVDCDGLPGGQEKTRPLDLAVRAGDGFGEPEALQTLCSDSPVLAERFRRRGVSLVRGLPARAGAWGWHWLEDARMESFAGFHLHLGGTLLGVLGVFSRESLSPEFIRQLHLSVNQLTVALEKARLLKQMRRRAEELAAANEELRELDAMKDWFVSAVSHELRTPLTNIRSFSEILENYADLAPQERREFAGIIREESERLSSMINNVLDLAKIANGEVDLEPEELDFRAVVGKCCRLFSQEAEERQIDFRLVLPEHTPHVYADEDAVNRVLNNLIGNAFKFTPEGGAVQVAVEPGGPAPEGARLVSVLISDTGVGIDVDDQQKVFEKFTQVGGRLTDKPPGTGIGLAICQEIVQKSGGEIWVQSAPEQGSTFGFSLPVAAAEQKARTQRSSTV